jgi:putative membrane protein
MVDWMSGGMVLWMLLWGVVGIAILLLAVISVIWLVRRTANNDYAQPRAEPAVEILRRRYAAGEIDEEEYLRRLSGLR